MVEAPALNPDMWSRERLSEYYADLNREITLAELRDMLNITVRCDDTNKIITFLAMLLTYTESDQINLAFNSESSSGKSYIPLEISEYFPREDVIKIAYCSPTAFFHDYGEWDEEQHIKRIDLSRKIIIFLDMPHDQLLQRLRPMLSHDQRELLVKITDRAKTQGLATKQALLIGFMTAIFCSTRYSMDAQERTRNIMLSPEIIPEKIRQALELISMSQANRPQYKEAVETSPERMFLSNRARDVRDAHIGEVIIPEELREDMLARFMEDHRDHLTPRLTRDFPRLFGLVKACALLNLHQRERVNNHLIATAADVEEAMPLYGSISHANELGIPPEVLIFYEETLVPEAAANSYTNKKDLARRYYETHRKTVGKKRLDSMIDMLLEAGLITEDKDPVDRRVPIYSPLQEIYSPGHVTKPDEPEIYPPRHATKLTDIPEYHSRPAPPPQELVTPRGEYISEEAQPS